MKRIGAFYNDVVLELKSIKWPTYQETLRLVAVVIIFSFFVAAYLGAADATFVALIKRFILKI